ncbi:hypothetical protein OQX61_03585 [Pedobacter sp. PLR]|uniref:CBU_0592 family membrane protein n=1 Tax=Pedobacter sp. PLR TaxID=2994465 RepID=UPI0022466BBA|nr:hypothetical protein [Pedobacter sp. PLR]MCX2450345.1 hypothetical protein [Pedobacter sp. PLR]
MFQIVITGIGWLGVILCTLGYLLLSLKVLTADSLNFQALNIIGGLCLVTSALQSSDMPNVVANLLWVFIGLYAVGRQFKVNRVTEKD